MGIAFRPECCCDDAEITVEAVPEKPLKTLTEHDCEAWERHGVKLGHIENGIACPVCGNELREPPNMQLLTYPPRVPVYCNVCQWNGSRLA